MKSVTVDRRRRPLKVCQVIEQNGSECSGGQDFRRCRGIECLKKEEDSRR